MGTVTPLPYAGRALPQQTGFDRDELTLTDRPNLLVVSGARKGASDDQMYLHRGIAQREFERRFELADHVKVSHASLERGLLTIALRREIPEALKPRRIPISGDEGGESATAARRIETPKAA